MKSDTRDWLLKLIPSLLNEGILTEEGILSCRAGGKIYFTPPFTPEKGLSRLRSEDILTFSEIPAPGEEEISFSFSLHRALYAARPEINALIHAASPAVKASSCAGQTVYPLLDDMAQIVGTSIKTAPSSVGSGSLKKAVKAFRGRNAVLLEDQGAVCGGSTLDEAHAVCQVCEKACKAFIESSFIGGGHRINPLESWLMRTVYLKKYSKQKTLNR